MRDSAGQCPDRFQALLLTHLLLESSALGLGVLALADVGRNNDRAVGLAIDDDRREANREPPKRSGPRLGLDLEFA